MACLNVVEVQPFGFRVQGPKPQTQKHQNVYARSPHGRRQYSFLNMGLPPHIPQNTGILRLGITQQQFLEPKPETLNTQLHLRQVNFQMSNNIASWLATWPTKGGRHAGEAAMMIFNYVKPRHLIPN